jgi:hypothetical protein
MIVSGFCKEVFRELPMEFAVEAQKLLGVSSRRAASGEPSRTWQAHRNDMLEIKNLHVPPGQEILRGIDLT